MKYCHDYNDDGRCDECGRSYREPDIQKCWDNDVLEGLLKEIRWCSNLPDNEIREELDKLINKYE